ncbi:MAG: MATE family efflux transporter [Lachnospiraceae bacterium]|nr:MATE family efflux transporter [Lachnospiraceae bacterium]
MKIQLSDHFDFKKLFRFVIPCIAMMIFTSIYGVVDGYFVSNYVGKTSFAAVNLIMPFIMILGALGFMFGTGGSALVAIILGEGDKERANQIFSFLVYTVVVLGCIIAVVGIIFIEPVAVWLGAEGEMISLCVSYGRIILCALPAFMLQNTFQSFFVTAEKPKLGLVVTLIAGVTNMALDALFMVVFKWGVEGAAVATALSQCVGGIVPMIYFFRKNNSLLKLTKTRFNGRALFKACTNGSSELVSNISMSLVSVLYNFQLMKYAGENGIAAYGVIMYVNFIFIAIFLGYSIGTAPIIGYNYGAGNEKELKNIFNKSMVFLIGAGITLTTAGFFLASPLSKFFVGYDAELCEMTIGAFKIYSISFLFVGFGIFGSSLFTALGNGLISAIVSFLRTIVFQVFSILIMPEIMGMEGIWYSVIVAEILATIVAIGFIVKYKKKYGY